MLCMRPNTYSGLRQVPPSKLHAGRSAYVFNTARQQGLGQPLPPSPLTHYPSPSQDPLNSTQSLGRRQIFYRGPAWGKALPCLKPFPAKSATGGTQHRNHHKTGKEMLDSTDSLYPTMHQVDLARDTEISIAASNYPIQQCNTCTAIFLGGYVCRRWPVRAQVPVKGIQACNARISPPPKELSIERS